VIASIGHGDDDVQDSGERAVLLATKLHVPASRRQLVRRTALLGALSAGRSRKLTLLSAPAGWGKTTLLSQWVAGIGGANEDLRLGWLSLDSSDNDPVWFWMYVIAALQKASPGVGSRAFELLAMGADPLQVVLPTLLNDLAATTGQLVLVLDDYHVVVSRAVHEQTAFVIDRMPATLRLVLASRSDPMLPLARLRASGDLLELRTDDLRFTDVEADQLLNEVLGLELTDADVQLLCRRTEGWVAGLYLAALSLAGRTDATVFIKTFAGDNRHIVDFLMAEVLDGQPPQLRSFLLHTSVLHRLGGALCDAVLEATDSASVLERIERENLFLVPLDLSRRWYRYHHLFGELLRTELQRAEPGLVPVLHRRAAAWFEDEGLVDEALRHLVAAGDIAASADLIAADWVNGFNEGSLSTVSGWLDLLPAQTVPQDARLSVARAWIALTVGQFDDARSWIEALEAKSDSRTTDDGALDAQLVVLRAFCWFKTGDVVAALEEARRAVNLDPGHVPLARSGAYCIYGAALYFSDSSDEAEAAFLLAAQLAEHAGDRRNRIYALGYLATIAAERGQLVEAEDLIRRATGSGAALADGEHFVDAMVSLAAATVLDMRGDWVAAADAARVAVVSARRGGGILEEAKALSTRADILEHLGDHQAAGAVRKEAGTLVAAAKQSVGVPVSRRKEDYPSSEELTPKELEVLRLLATRLSRREIGQRLYVSLNTVKTHQRGVYRKLGVADRSSAVKRATQLGLL
jgi:LuxR family transcriptional regulator, maltose regulon positive regulatory protein